MDSLNVLIVGTANPQATNSVGEQFISGMLAGYPESQVHRLAINQNVDRDSIDWRGSTCHLRRVQQSWLPVLAPLSIRKFRSQRLPALVDDFMQIVKQHQTDVIWSFLNSIPMFHLMDSLLDKADLPFVVSSWDSPEYLVSKSRLDWRSKANALGSFSRVIKSAQEVISICPQMSNIYLEQYGVQSKPMPFCPPKENWLKIKGDQPNGSGQAEGPVKIVFAGSLYATTEWNHFLAAVQSYNLANPPRRFEVTCIGNQGRRANRMNWVKYLPLKPSEEAARIINQSNLAYLPYWMDKRYSFFAKTAFPSKLPFYVASGTPVFFHGPRDSTPADFIRKYPVGTNCHSLNANSIIASLKQAISDSKRQEFIRARQDTFQNELNPNLAGKLFAETVTGIRKRKT